MTENIRVLEPEVHPFAIFLDGFTEEVEAPEYVIDNAVAAATVVIAGERGLGKTSMLVPLMIAATGLLEHYPLNASIRRKVVYVAEDAAQVRRIIAAMRSAGLITCSREDFNHRFRIVEAKRIQADQIVKVVPQYDDLWTANRCADGSEYLAPPVMVLDTTNATIDLDNISDNSEVSGAVSTLRQGFGLICLVLVGHVAKASRSDARQISFIGAGAWEGDTQQTIYLVSEDDQRYMVLGKKRFEADTTEYRITSHASTFEAQDKLKRTVEIRCIYGIPEATNSEAKEEAKAQAQAERKAAAWSAVQTRVINYVTNNPGATKRNVQKTVMGKEGTVKEALEELVEQGAIEVRPGESGAFNHYPVKKDTPGYTPEW